MAVVAAAGSVVAAGAGRKNPVNCGINLEPQPIAEALAQVVVACDGAI